MTDDMQKAREVVALSCDVREWSRDNRGGHPDDCHRCRDNEPAAEAIAAALREARERAWFEGYEACARDEVENKYTPNPYRKPDAT